MTNTTTTSQKQDIPNELHRTQDELKELGINIKTENGALFLRVDDDNLIYKMFVDDIDLGKTFMLSQLFA